MMQAYLGRHRSLQPVQLGGQSRKETVASIIPNIAEYWWRARIGFAPATEYLFTGDLMTATEAERIELINHVVPGDQLDERVYGLPGDWLAARCGRSPRPSRPSIFRCVSSPIR
jgi:enoyl-CoA hydratase/carnithine racemase